MRYPAHMRLTLDFTWTVLGPIVAPTGKLVMPEAPPEAGVYRFLVYRETGIEVYIGETIHLRLRMLGGYASTHQGTTNVRVRRLLLGAILEGCRIELEIAANVRLEQGNESIIAELSRTHIRRLVENVALEEAIRSGYRVHNL